MAKLTDKQKKQMIADYLDCENYSAVARKYEVSRTTVKKVVESDGEIGKKLKDKQEENTQDVLQYMEKKKDKVCELIGEYLTQLVDPYKLQEASIKDIGLSLGIVIDKFANIGKADDENGKLEKLIEGLKK